MTYGWYSISNQVSFLLALGVLTVDDWLDLGDLHDGLDILWSEVTQSQ